MGRKYYKPDDGEWIVPVASGYKLRCCDCGLVHTVDFRRAKRTSRFRKNGTFTFRLMNGTVAFRVYRDQRATSAIRRKKSKRKLAK